MMHKNSALNELCNSNISNFQSPASYDSVKYLTYVTFKFTLWTTPHKGCWFERPLYMLPQVLQIPNLINCSIISNPKPKRLIQILVQFFGQISGLSFIGRLLRIRDKADRALPV